MFPQAQRRDREELREEVIGSVEQHKILYIQKEKTPEAYPRDPRDPIVIIEPKHKAFLEWKEECIDVGMQV